MKFKTTRIGLLTLTFLFGGIVAYAQGPNGTYEGMVKVPQGPEQKLALELKTEGAKVTGRAKHGDRSIDITDGKFENGTLTLVFDTKDHTFVGKVDGDKITGEAGDGAQKIPIELKKVKPAAAAAPATAAAPAAGAVNLNGQWDAVADANGQPFPFVLVLKVDGETVTGSSSSQLGESTVKAGTWKDGKLVFQLEGQNGTISMTGAIVDGKLAGEFDYSGQLQGRWVAVKKN